MKTTTLAATFILLTGLPAAADPLLNFDQVISEPAVSEPSVSEADFVAAEPTASEVMEDLAEQDPNIDVTLNEQGDVDGIVMLSDVLFGFGQAELSPDSIAALESLAKSLHSVEGLELIGHTDSVGSDDFNLQLGQARAEAVSEWLIAGGYIEPEAVIASSAGESAPIAENAVENSDNPEGRARNRRVEFRLVEAATDSEDPVDLASAEVAPETDVSVQ